MTAAIYIPLWVLPAVFVALMAVLVAWDDARKRRRDWERRERARRRREEEELATRKIITSLARRRVR